MSNITKDAAHGGPGWSPRLSTLREEIGELWGSCGVSNEWGQLRSVLIHKPGLEINSVTDANQSLMLSVPDVHRARSQHDGIMHAYQNVGINVSYVDPIKRPPPNLMFVADLFFMTPEGAILARPASTVRAGEECHVLRKLVELGIPILRSIRGKGVFEGADASWINSSTVIIGIGLRTNIEGANQVKSALEEMGVEGTKTNLPEGTMHLMGTLRFINKDQVVVWENRISKKVIGALQENGYDVSFIPDEKEAVDGMALNFVTLGPDKILMPTGNPKTQLFYEKLGVQCLTVDVDELHKAAGGIGCMTGILHRE